MAQPDETSQPARSSSLRDRLTTVPDAAAPAPGDEAASPPRAAPDEVQQAGRARSGAAKAARRPPRFAPHAARTAQRARRTWLTLLFFPFFAIYVVVDALRELRDRLARERRESIERRPPFRRPAAMGDVADRSMDDIVAVLEGFPFRPAKISTQHAFFRDHGADAISALLSPNPQISTSPHFYPPWFQQRLFVGDQGIHLAGMQAMHDRPAPAVIICHGLLMTKNFDIIIQLARRAYEQWGFHVVTLDLRGWGQSAWTTDAPASAGYHEGRDILEACRELRRDPRVTSVGGIGFSLGGASMLNAAYASSMSEDRPLDGGAVAISAPTVVSDALTHVSTKPHWRDPYFGLWHLFRAVIKANVRRRRLRRDLITWYDLVEELSTPYYGITMDEFCERASAGRFAAEIDQPVLQLHAADDFLVPVHHAYRLREATADNPWVHVMVRDAGAHCSFAAVDPAWFHSTLRRWLEYWAMPGVTEPDDAPID